MLIYHDNPNAGNQANKNKNHKNVERKQTATYDVAPLTSPSSPVVSIDTVMQSRLYTK